MATNISRAEAAVGGNPMSQLRIRVPDVDRAARFFGALFGWKFQREALAAGSTNLALGIFPGPAPTVRFWCVVGAIEPAIAKVCQLGGKALERAAMGPYSVCDCLDDQGTAFGLWHDPQLELAWPDP